MDEEIAVFAVWTSGNPNIERKPCTARGAAVEAARDCGATAAYIPGLAMNKAADPYPAGSKIDA